MKIFMSASPRGKWEKAKQIYRLISDEGHKHTSNFVESVDPKSFYKQDSISVWRKRYSQRIIELKKADACVFEVSIHSFNVGHLLSLALQHNKPTAVIHSSDFTPFAFIGMEENAGRFFMYQDDGDLRYLVRDVLDDLESQLDKRFTMIMSPSLIKKIDRRSKELNINYSEYIRKLVVEDRGGE